MKRICILPAALLLIFTGCAGKNELRLGAGDPGGTYYSYGSQLVESIEANDKTLKFRICETAGSAANIRLLDEGYLQLALTQGDMLWNAANGTGAFDEKHTGFSAVAGLYMETCQIVVPADSDVSSVSDLYGKKVSLGEKESGALQNAKQILSAYGLDESMLDAQYLSFTDSAKLMQQNALDAFFCTAGAPTPVVSELSETFPIRLIPVGAEQAELIIKQNSGYAKGVVDAGTYKGQDNDTETLAVKNVLVASNSLPEETVKKITGEVIRNAGNIQQSEGISLESATADIPIGFHKGAAAYYLENGVEVSENTASQQRKVFASADGG